MQREKIILSDFDLDILSFVKEERFLKEITKRFGADYLTIKKHIDRLNEIECISIIPFGTFKKIQIKHKGLKIVNLLNENVN